MSALRRDRRIDKTRAALAAALFRLVGRMDWEMISVSSICQEADVARSTFYLHFESPTALLDDMIATTVRRLTEEADGPLPVLEWLVDHVAANRPVFHRTVVAAQSTHVFDRFKAGVLHALIHEHRTQGGDMSPTRLAMLIGAAFEGMQHWAKGWKTAELPTLKRDIRTLQAVLSTGASGTRSMVPGGVG